MSARHLGILSLVLVAGLAADVRLEAQQLPDEAADHEIATAPVEFDGAVLFRVRGVSSYPAARRARQIRDRLAAIAADPGVPVDSLRIVESGNVSHIWAGNQPVMGVFDADAELEQVGRDVLAGSHLSNFKQAITSYREARTPAALRRNVVTRSSVSSCSPRRSWRSRGSGGGSTASWRGDCRRASARLASSRSS